MEKFKSYLQWNGYAPSSIQSYEYQLIAFLKWTTKKGLVVEQMKQEQILDYLNFCKIKGNSNKTLSSRVSALRHYFDFLEVPINPLTHIKIKGVKRRILVSLLSERQLECLFIGIGTKSMTQQRNKAIMSLLVFQGLTTSECWRLEVADIDLKRQTIYIKKSRITNDRTLILDQRQLSIIRIYLENARPQLIKHKPEATNRCFLTVGTGICPSALKNAFAKLFKKLRKTHIHLKNAQQIRASVIANWLKSYNLRQVQYMAGHRYVSSTERYSFYNLEELQEKLELFHPLGSSLKNIL